MLWIYFCTRLDPWKKISFNEAQCLIRAQGEIHISSAGGNAILGSYFGGKNIIIGRSNAGDGAGEYFEKRKVWHSDSWLKFLSNAEILSIDLNLKDSWLNSIINYIK